MKPTPMQREALELAAADPMGALIGPTQDPTRHPRFWIQNGAERQLMESQGPGTDPPSVLNATVQACLRAGWFEVVESVLDAAAKTPPHRLKITDAGRRAIT